MIGIDTNILVRYFVKDDPVQTPVAVQVVNGLTHDEPGWLAAVVVAELAWTLRRIYKMDRFAIGTIVEKLLDSRDVVMEESDTVQQALMLYRKSKADFSDCLIAVGARIAGCSRVVTFDRIAARDLGMERIA